MYASRRAHSAVIGHTPEDFRRAAERCRAPPPYFAGAEVERISLLKMSTFEIQPYVLDPESDPEVETGQPEVSQVQRLLQDVSEW